MFIKISNFHTLPNESFIKMELLDLILKGHPRKLGKTKKSWQHPYLFSGITNWAKSNLDYNKIVTLEKWN